MRAQVKLSLGQTAEGQADLRETLRLAVDNGFAVHRLINSYPMLSERREALAFVEQELKRQVVFGDGLQAYRDAARLNLDPEALLESLRVALRERPDLFMAWSVVTQQLTGMLELEEASALPALVPWPGGFGMRSCSRELSRCEYATGTARC